tara:strand:+ start:1290 stop:1634 length:345 start_codon:yes stop_codon:yes gene_type:complete
MFNDLAKIKWDGKEYDCPITMRLAKAMERGGVNILASALELDKGGVPKVTFVAEIYSWILGAGGCEVTEEEIYISIMSNLSESTELITSAKYAVNLFFPKIDSPERSSKKTKKS